MPTYDYKCGKHDASEEEFENRVLEYDATFSATFARIMTAEESLECMRVVTDDSVQTVDSAGASLGYRRI